MQLQDFGWLAGASWRSAHEHRVTNEYPSRVSLSCTQPVPAHASHAPPTGRRLLRSRMVCWINTECDGSHSLTPSRLPMASIVNPYSRSTSTFAHDPA